MENKISDIQKLKQIYTNKLENIRKSKLSENTIKDYAAFVNQTLENVNTESKDEKYRFFEYLTIEVCNIGLYNSLSEKEEIIENIYKHFKQIFTDDKIFEKYLNLIKEIFIENKYPYFEMQDKILGLLLEMLKQNGKVDKTINFLKKELNQKESDALAIFLLKLIKKYKGKNKAVIEAEKYLYSPQICDYLIKYYQTNPNKLRQILARIIKEGSDELHEK
ncbi:MAG TPA: hypothetical protein IAB27_02285 [Candidatus Coprosoma intestinipullorum]|uniref:Uncharacterized protein n=1 Tax=Candidatus Coprosoma intestinipullorum TaxID=2840752 RepID=A0A9D0ZQL5_9FIRM|nr:hypothetical protein [Candidatus Coprosoma intestinipullorum]